MTKDQEEFEAWWHEITVFGRPENASTATYYGSTKGGCWHIWQAMKKAALATAIPEGCPPHAEIYLGQGSFALCDWIDFDKVKSFCWKLSSKAKGRILYAQAHDYRNASGRKRIAMHRLILDAPDDLCVDHINGNGLDNRRSNLRLATILQNGANQKAHPGTSVYKGVCYVPTEARWRAYLTQGGKRISLGRHATEIDAAIAYDTEAIKRFREFAKTNLLLNPYLSTPT